MLSACSKSEEAAMAEGATAQAQLDAGQIAEARVTIARAIDHRDDIIALHLLRARVEYAAGSIGTSFEAYNDALALDTTNPDALLGVSQLGLQTGHFAESEDATTKVLALDPEQPEALLVRGLHNIFRARNADALKSADAILAKYPDNDSGAILRARALAQLGRTDDAMEQITKLQQKMGNTVPISRTLLELYRRTDKPAGMIQQFDFLRQGSPQDVALIIDEANTLYKMGNIPRGRAFTRHLISKDKLADRTVDSVIRLWREYDPEPLDPAAIEQLGGKASKQAKKALTVYYLRRNEPDKARLALGNDMTDGDFPALLAQIAIAKGQTEAGRRQAATILSTDKTQCYALVAKAQADVRQGRADDAIIAAQTAYANCPENVAAYLVLVDAQLATENWNAANLTMRAATSRNSQDSELAGIYIDFLEKKGRGMQAVSTARRVTQSAPALVSGWKQYRALCIRHPEAGCTDSAEFGLKSASQRFAIDLRPDEKPPIGLFVQLQRPRVTEKEE